MAVIVIKDHTEGGGSYQRHGSEVFEAEKSRIESGNVESAALPQWGAYVGSLYGRETEGLSRSLRELSEG